MGACCLVSSFLIFDRVGLFASFAMTLDTSPESETPSESSPPVTAEVEGALEELRQLLNGPEREEVAGLREEVRAGQLNAKSLAQVLPSAVRLSGEDGTQLADALSPTVDRAIEVSIERNPQPMIDAIFPIIGPAIRKAVSDALAKAVSGLNETLEHSLSIQSIRWRLEAKRTGKTFGEVLLLKTLRYRVEQVFLIHAETGLLLHHVTAPDVAARDAELVSGMLTAVTDFVRDSFAGREDDKGAGLQKLRVGGTSVWVERGPHAVLAAAVRGEGPEGLREVFEESVESVHQRFHQELEGFEGDNALFVGTDPDLSRCLVSAQMPRRGKHPLMRWLLTALLLAGLVAGVAFAVRSTLRWNRFVTALRMNPGVLLVDYNHNWWGQSTVAGLYDVRARKTPYMVLNESEVSVGEVLPNWQIYEKFSRRTDSSVSAGEAMAVNEGVDPAAWLKAPASVRFKRRPVGVSGEVQWAAHGAASHAWLKKARVQLAAGGGANGVTLTAASVDWSAVTDVDAVALEVATAALAAVEVPMPNGADVSSPEAQKQIERAADRVREVARCAAALNYRFTLVLTGHTDAAGDAQANERLSLARAEAVAEALKIKLKVLGERPAAMVKVGEGSRRPRVPGTALDELQKANRRVMFEARLESR